MLNDVSNNGKVWKNHPKVQIQDHRRRTDAPPDEESSSIGLWIVIAALAVVVATFWPVLGGRW